MLEQAYMMQEKLVHEGCTVLLYSLKGKSWLVKVDPRLDFHTHVGVIRFSDLIGKRFGDVIKTNLGQDIILLEPFLIDYLMKSERKTQIVYPKDIGLIVMETGICPGSVVVEAGTGSGVLTTAIANFVRPTGKVYSYEIRPEFIEIAERNLKKAGLQDYVVIKNRDASHGFDEKNVDAVLIDVGAPWMVAGPAYNALKGGGAIAAILPTINQAEKLAIELKRHGFVNIHTVELLCRGIEAREGMSRPSTRMIAHTAYLMFARKAFLKVNTSFIENSCEGSDKYNETESI
ncbi:MAG: tRNA (adenine-N1)-methyltransferase [Nitrososphaeria archaeon]|nr:tRNA (adenine-N1)-methyltransferase [Nitrososphaeria archaeon]